jgi:O-antigen ligase
MHGEFPGGNFEEAIRLSLGLLVLLTGLAHCPAPALRRAIGGVYIAALAATVHVAWLAFHNDMRPVTEIYNAVGYGNLMLLLATLTLFSLGWRLTPWLRTERALKVGVTVLTLTGFVLTQTRSGWIAVPAFAVIGIMLMTGLRRPWRAAGMVVGVIIVALVIGLSSESLRNRAHDGYTEAIACTGAQSTNDTSICIRFQLWRAAWDMFVSNPVAGIGDSRLFSENLNTKYLSENVVSPFVAQNFGEPHNDLMKALSSFGVPGGIGLLLVYFAPLWIFMRRLHQTLPLEARSAAAMGAAFCLGFAIFGLTELMFRGMRTVSFYTMFVALFLILSDPRTPHHKPVAAPALH